jgi:predicted nucleic acid-binding Zn ribbon protein
MTRPTHCLTCGCPLEQQQIGRPRYYCSDKCRVKAYRQRKRQAAATAAPQVQRNRVQVTYCPQHLFTHSSFTWTDFKASLGVWPDGMRVRYRGIAYEVQGAQLQRLKESSS